MRFPEGDCLGAFQNGLVLSEMCRCVVSEDLPMDADSEQRPGEKRGRGKDFDGGFGGEGATQFRVDVPSPM